MCYDLITNNTGTQCAPTNPPSRVPCANTPPGDQQKAWEPLKAKHSGDTSWHGSREACYDLPANVATKQSAGGVEAAKLPAAGAFAIPQYVGHVQRHVIRLTRRGRLR